MSLARVHAWPQLSEDDSTRDARTRHAPPRTQVPKPSETPPWAVEVIKVLIPKLTNSVSEVRVRARCPSGAVRCAVRGTWVECRLWLALTLSHWYVQEVILSFVEILSPIGARSLCVTAARAVVCS